MAGFYRSGSGLSAPDFANCGPELPKVSGCTRNIPVFWRLAPETGFDRHCVNEFAVQLAKFCVAHYARPLMNSAQTDSF
jgi:hypothetical protein